MRLSELASMSVWVLGDPREMEVVCGKSFVEAADEECWERVSGEEGRKRQTEWKKEV